MCALVERGMSVTWQRVCCSRIVPSRFRASWLVRARSLAPVVEVWVVVGWQKADPSAQSLPQRGHGLMPFASISWGREPWENPHASASSRIVCLGMLGGAVECHAQRNAAGMLGHQMLRRLVVASDRAIV